jgi:hypothetical protein
MTRSTCVNFLCTANNSLTGPIPTELGRFTNLNYLYFGMFLCGCLAVLFLPVRFGDSSHIDVYASNKNISLSSLSFLGA